MQRTQIYLEPELASSLDRLAEARKTSRAEVIREAARRFVRAEGRTGDESYGSILDLAGRGHGGPGNVSERHDDFLVDEKLAKRQT
jgi:hypothetical protein